MRIPQIADFAKRCTTVNFPIRRSTCQAQPDFLARQRIPVQRRTEAITDLVLLVAMRREQVTETRTSLTYGRAAAGAHRAG